MKACGTRLPYLQINNMDNNLVNNNLIKFWDSVLTLDDEYKNQIKQIPVSEYKELAPSEKLFKATFELGKCGKVLDYGCGNGWASIIASKGGCQDIDAVDLGSNIIEAAKFHFEHFEVKVNCFEISANWLKNTAKSQYNGVICSNVLDVLPLETSKEIIENIARVCLPESRVIIGLNFYMDKESASKRGMELVDGKYLFVNDVLRLTSLSDDEWKGLFSSYFEIEKLEHFAWPGEQAETRRLFYLKKK